VETLIHVDMAAKKRANKKPFVIKSNKTSNTKATKRATPSGELEKERVLIKEEIEARPITTLGEFIHIIEKYCDSDYILFRGQNSDWPLLPKLCRLQTRDASIIETERKMLEDFKRLSKPYLTKFPLNNWEWIALAQHHGLPTRLLDWSTNPLAALWFAVSQVCSSEEGVVWIFFLEENHFLTPNQLSEIDPFEENEAKVFQPEISTIRIQSQSGWFTTQQFQQGKSFVAFDKLSKYSNSLLKLKIPKKAFSPLRFQLDRLGVNRSALFQDLDGIASYVEWVHSVGSDEGEEEKLRKGRKGNLQINFMNKGKDGYPKKGN
jgi:hypothetical protein